MKFNNIFILLLSLVWAQSAAASGSYYVESQNYLANKTFSPGLVSILNQDVNDDLGGFLAMVLSPSYAEFYFGPTLVLSEHVQLGIGAGLEKDSTQLRTGSFAYLEQDTYSALISAEYGASGFYYVLDAGKQVNDNLLLGIFAQRFTGIGPKVSYSFSKMPVSIWLAPQFDPESKLFGAVASLRGTVDW